MALADGLALVLVIQGLCAFRTDIDRRARIGVHDRLSAPVHAAARATHDFDEGVVLLALLDRIQQFGCHAGAGGRQWSVTG